MALNCSQWRCRPVTVVVQFLGSADEVFVSIASDHARVDTLVICDVSARVRFGNDAVHAGRADMESIIA